MPWDWKMIFTTDGRGSNMDLRDFMTVDRKISEETSPDYQICQMLMENQAETMYFDNVKGTRFHVAGNIIPTREKMCSALGTDKKGYIDSVMKALQNPVKPKILDDKGPCQEKSVNGLSEIPILKHFQKDAGKYITSGIVVAKNCQGERNASFHRMMVVDDDTLAIRLVERHLHQFYCEMEEKGEPLDVAILVGLHPAILFASAYSLPQGMDEFQLASSFLGNPLELVPCEKVQVEVPRLAELVIEGQIVPNERVDEGPFTDITGTYDIVRKQPVIKVKKITHRKDPIYHALAPSGQEHRNFMGMPQEPRIFNSVNSQVKAVNACLTEGGCNWLHGVVSIKKEMESDGKKAIEAALKGHPSMKHVAIVDEDIDIFDSKSVEFAIATRFQGDRDIVMVKNVKGSSLDPSAGKSSMTTKLGLDATKPLGREEDFETARIPR